MTTISDALGRIREVRIAPRATPAIQRGATRLARVVGARVAEEAVGVEDRAPGVFELHASTAHLPASLAEPANAARPAIVVRLDADGRGLLAASESRFAYGALDQLLTRLSEDDVAPYRGGRVLPIAFPWQRSVYDFFLAQEGRIQQGLDRERYLERLASRGFTHVEVNGLAASHGLETGPPGEIYPMFYTYGPALDQFVASRLNAGLYPAEHLRANLANLKRNAELAVRYGLVPGLLCFEPRSVPDAIFDRYPMLRGARVDHPFRSFKPRFNLTIAHPAVREHYAELVRALLGEVPELEFLSIWSNDSGAGFEYTKSLYVGRNGGAYLIREWKGDDEIARAAGENALRFLQVLRDAGRAINPAFRVMTRLEPFYGEHEVVWSGLGDAVDVESASLIGRGWQSPYAHPRYPDSHAINGGAVHQRSFDTAESQLIRDLDARGAWAHFYVAGCPQAMFAPLVAVPYPRLLGRRLAQLHAGGVRCLAHLGGTAPPELAPFDPNHELLAAYQYDPGLDVDAEVDRIARRWAGDRFARPLLGAWKGAEDAILAFPNTIPLYSTFGFVWYRLWVRPFVPNIAALAEDDRAYYQDFMCTTPHNPNNVDLSRDVLFRLASPETCARDLTRADAHVWRPLDRAISGLRAVEPEAGAVLGPANVIADQLVRLRALRCWLRTQRSVLAWTAGVYGYLAAKADGAAERMVEARRHLREMAEQEIANTRELIELVDSGVEFMATTDQAETPLIFGRNFRALLERRAALMRAHIDDEPHIDPHYVERQAARRWDRASEQS